MALTVQPEGLPPADLVLLERCQHGFPLVAEPFRALAAERDGDEAAVLAAFARARQAGMLSRIGAVFAPNTIGASTLAALAVPPDQLDGVAHYVSSRPEVNHNYARAHRYNLWFVVAAETAAQVAAVLGRIHLATGYPPLNLPLQREYHLDLGFDFLSGGGKPAGVPPRRLSVQALDAAERRLAAALTDGLALEPRPFARLAVQCRSSERQVLATLAAWQDSGVMRRFGAVLRHRALGYRANAMCVWQVAAEELDAVGQRLAGESAITLCYARTPRPPQWPYNLYSMIHAPDALTLSDEVAALNLRCGLAKVPRAVLLSTRCYTQRAANYGGRAHV